MKILLVSFIPRGERSHTNKLLQSFIKEINSQNKNVEINTLDLIENIPDMFIKENVIAYIKKYYLGEKLEPAVDKTLVKMEQMTTQLMETDVVVLATPMYNFSFPAIVKAWFDSVMLKGKTWDVDKEGNFQGLMKGKKALLLMASGGIYEGDMETFEHAASLAKTEFNFMGFSDVRVVTVSGINMDPDKVDEIIKKGQKEIQQIVTGWF